MISICDDATETPMSDLIACESLVYASGRRGKLYVFKSPSKVRSVIGRRAVSALGAPAFVGVERHRGNAMVMVL